MEAYVRPWLLAVILTCLAPLGCRGPDPSIELLESELRCMEDQLYEMDRQLGIYCAQLESCRRYNASLRLQLATTENLSTPEPQPAPKPAQQETETGQAPQTAEPSFDDADLTVPEIDYGPSETTPESNGSESNGSAQEAPTTDSERDSTPTANSDDVTRRHLGNADVSRIVLNNRLTGGYNFDGRPGDDGLLVVIEPQNAAGKFLPLPGDVAVTVLDPDQSGLAAPIARWEFDAAETTAMMKQTLLGRGIHLQLPWPDEPPRGDRLKLQVNYRSIKGHACDAEREVRLNQGIAKPRPGPVARGLQRPVTRLSPWEAARQPNLAPRLWTNRSRQTTSNSAAESASPSGAGFFRRRLAPQTGPLPRLATPRASVWSPFR